MKWSKGLLQPWQVFLPWQVKTENVVYLVKNPFLEMRSTATQGARIVSHSFVISMRHSLHLRVAVSFSFCRKHSQILEGFGTDTQSHIAVSFSFKSFIFKLIFIFCKQFSFWFLFFASWALKSKYFKNNNNSQPPNANQLETIHFCRFSFFYCQLPSSFN